MSLSHKIDLVKQYLIDEEKAILQSSSFKIHCYVPIAWSILAETMGPKVFDVNLGLDRTSSEWGVCIQYTERVKGCKELTRTYAVKNMNSYCLIDALNTLPSLKQELKSRRETLETLFTNAAEYVKDMTDAV